MGPTSIMMPDLSLVADRPFLFVIRDSGTGQILFLGRVLDRTRYMSPQVAGPAASQTS